MSYAYYGRLPARQALGRIVLLFFDNMDVETERVIARGGKETDGSPENYPSSGFTSPRSLSAASVGFINEPVHGHRSLHAFSTPNRKLWRYHLSQTWIQPML